MGEFKDVDEDCGAVNKDSATLIMEKVTVSLPPETSAISSSSVELAPAIPGPSSSTLDLDINYEKPRTIIKRLNEIIDGREIALNIRSDDLVKFFKNDKGLENYLVNIWHGKSSMGCPLERHNYMKRYNEELVHKFDANSDIIKWANRLFIKDNKTDDLLNHICGELFDSDKMANGDSYDHNYFRRHYIPYVLVPEGIIYYLMTTEKLMYKEANEIFTNEQCATGESISKSTMDDNSHEENVFKSGASYQDHQVDEDEDPNGDFEIPDFDKPDSDFESENEDNTSGVQTEIAVVGE